MTEAGGTWLKTEYTWLSPSDIARGARELVEQEVESLCAWQNATPEERETVRTIVRAALLRLLETTHWMPGAVQCNGRRLDVRLTIEFDADVEAQLAITREQLRRESVRTRHRLIELVRELEEAEDGSAS